MSSAQRRLVNIPYLFLFWALVLAAPALSGEAALLL